MNEMNATVKILYEEDIYQRNSERLKIGVELYEIKGDFIPTLHVLMLFAKDREPAKEIKLLDNMRQPKAIRHAIAVFDELKAQYTDEL